MQLAARSVRNVQRYVRIRQGHDIHVAHMLRHVLRELRQIGTGLHVFARPAEARSRVTRAHGMHDLGHVRGIQRPEQALRLDHGDVALRECDELLERRERIAHAALRSVRHQLQRVTLEGDALHLADGAEPAHQLLG